MDWQQRELRLNRRSPVKRVRMLCYGHWDTLNNLRKKKWSLWAKPLFNLLLSVFLPPSLLSSPSHLSLLPPLSFPHTLSHKQVKVKLEWTCSKSDERWGYSGLKQCWGDGEKWMYWKVLSRGGFDTIESFLGRFREKESRMTSKFLSWTND